ncbi:tyrosine-type recombinase/integrase [Pannus brasiliensis CCIBt3594]|uniref:Tyrosine-type recombinase/integrase n=1 Tax=Pannus brasiliensis CCIBt3594 TaxID=1427578 RepID=A0AAW9QYV8_9CHRO
MPSRLETRGPEDLRLAAPVPLTLHPAGVYLAGLSAGSRRTIRYSLDRIASLLTDGKCDALTLDWSKLRYRHTAAVRVALLRDLAPVTVNKMLSALRRVLLEALRLELMSAEDYRRAIDLPSVNATTEPRGRSLDTGEISALLATCRGATPLDVRDAAIVALLRGTGLRRAELVGLDRGDLNLAAGEVLIRKGKRGKSRRVYLSPEVGTLVERWLALRGNRSGPLFCRVRRGGHLEIARMNPDSIWRMLNRRAALAGLEPFSPHDFRRTFCSDLLDAGVDIVTVGKLAGHASPATTARYDRRGEEIGREAVRKLALDRSPERFGGDGEER